MAQADKFDYISIAYRSRLLYRSDAEFRDALGVSFETVANNRHSARDMEMYLGVLSKCAENETALSIVDVIDAYVEASEAYLTLDWGDRTQMASRRKFCRMLFRLYATEGKSLSNEELFKFKIKNDDRRLLNAFFPDGTDNAPAVDVRWITLFAFGVVRPYAEGLRWRDIADKETFASLKKLRGLIEVLKADMPRLGATDKPLAFDEWLSIVDSNSDDGDSPANCTPLWMFSALMDISEVCRSLVIAERQRLENEQLCGLKMHGIWIDDGDCGKTRFWIFPDNCIMAFCYQYDGYTWNLHPYEFKVRFSDNPEYLDSFIMISPAGDLAFTLSPDKIIKWDQMSKGLVKGELSENTYELTRLTFYEETLKFPDWFDWQSWERLSHEDERYGRFHAVIRDIYNKRSPHSMFFRNVAPELTDSYNNLAGRDNKYLYIYDWQPKRCVVREEERDFFLYEIAPGEEIPYVTLFELKISEKHPLYAIPLNVEQKNYNSWELERFVTMLSDAENIREACIVHSDLSPVPVLVFPTYGVTIGLDKTNLEKLGIKKFTTQPFQNMKIE